MGFMDLLQATDWQQAYRLLTRGNVPLILQLLILNTIFLIAYVAHKATSRYKMRQGSVMAVQGVLIAANLAVVMQDVVLPMFRKYTIF